MLKKCVFSSSHCLVIVSISFRLNSHRVSRSLSIYILLRLLVLWKFFSLLTWLTVSSHFHFISGSGGHDNKHVVKRCELNIVESSAVNYSPVLLRSKQYEPYTCLSLKTISKHCFVLVVEWSHWPYSRSNLFVLTKRYWIIVIRNLLAMVSLYFNIHHSICSVCFI